MELTLLRPLWLLALIPWLWQGWRRRRDPGLLSPAMQAYLLPSRHRAIPWRWLACLPVILALSGPALRQQSLPMPSPALDIWLLDLSDSMLAQDLAPDCRGDVDRILARAPCARDAPDPLAAGVRVVSRPPGGGRPRSAACATGEQNTWLRGLSVEPSVPRPTS